MIGVIAHPKLLADPPEPLRIGALLTANMLRRAGRGHHLWYVPRMPLPPPPWAVRRYFEHRARSLGRLTDEQLAGNEALWLEICGVGPRRYAGSDDEAVEGPADASLREASPVTHFRPGCAECGRGFRVGRAWSRFCSDACRMRAYRRRKVSVG